MFASVARRERTPNKACSVCIGGYRIQFHRMKRGRKGYGVDYAMRVSRKGQVLLSQEIMRRLRIKPNRTRLEIVVTPTTIILKPHGKT